MWRTVGHSDAIRFAVTDVSWVGAVMMTDEERAELEKEQQAAMGGTPPTPGVTPSTSTTAPSSTTPEPATPAATAAESDERQGKEQGEPPGQTSTHLIAHTPGAGGSNTPSVPNSEDAHDKKEAPHADKKGKSKLSPEQRKKLKELDAQRKKEMEERYVHFV